MKSTYYFAFYAHNLSCHRIVFFRFFLKMNLLQLVFIKMQIDGMVDV